MTNPKPYPELALIEPHAGGLIRLFRTVRRRAAGFSLLQILAVLAILAILTSIGIGGYQRVEERARRAQCDVNLKAITIALDAYRQENGHYPTSLEDLLTSRYLTDPNLLRCPDDPNPNDTYDTYYIVRNAHDSSDLPVVVCPFHENYHEGAQGFLGRYSTQFSVCPAVLRSASAATVQRVGQTQQVAAASGIALHGGDRIRTEASGAAVIAFADGSTATLTGNCDVTVLQSFIDGENDGPLYTIVRQGPSSAIKTVLGSVVSIIAPILHLLPGLPGLPSIPVVSSPTGGAVTYDVHHGSKFDVVTPTATAGARGTKFTVTVAADGSAQVIVLVDTVQVSGLVQKATISAGKQLSFLFQIL